MKIFSIIMLIIMTSIPASAMNFNHQHTVFDNLLSKHVRWINKGTASRVDYAGFQKDRGELKSYLDDLSSASMKDFNSWTRTQQLAFLLNAYNAFTIELILTKYPDLKSIKDTGSFLKSPWKQNFFKLLGEKRHLDWIEHDMIRKPGLYDDPRIHTAVNCASIGCPALRDRAFTSENLDADLEDNLRRFLKDKSRNRYNSKTGKLEVSKIFDWYGDDFKKGYRGIKSLKEFFAGYADLLAEKEEDQAEIRNKKAGFDFLEYDWNLNDI